VKPLPVIAEPSSLTTGAEMKQFVAELFPICRSITGNGLRSSLEAIRRLIPIEIHEVPSGTKVFDWIVPPEWNIQDAYIKNSRGERLVDFRKSNLHVVNYSVPVRAKMSLAQLRPHLFFLPEHPDWIPYRTSYYSETWGFCLTYNQFQQLRDDEEYEVCVDSSLSSGALSYGELFIKGQTAEEVLISCHCCHPSLANDNLSGMAVAAFLAHRLSENANRLSYRFVFIPGTIGSIAWLSRNEGSALQIRHGLVLTCLGDSGGFTYKRSRGGSAQIDRAVSHLLQHSQTPFQVQDFSPYGYDERQYGSPGFNLPVGRLSRTANGCYAEYHTSADDLDFVQAESLEASLEMVFAALQLLERNKTYLNLNPKCEPQLGRRGLYRALGGLPNAGTREMAMLWVLNLSDGSRSLLDIAERARLPFEDIFHAAHLLVENSLLREQARTDFPETT
jgi:aminopeptidase-like protein